MNREEDAKGNLISISAMWKYGENADSPDYRFTIYCNKDTKIEDYLDEDDDYTDEKVGGKDAKACADSSGAIYQYIIQNGKDVYEIYNSGKSGWLGVTRSDASKEAFKAFAESVKF